MSLNSLKNLDYKGLALRHFEKAFIALASCVLLLCLVSSMRTARTAAKISPEDITELADAVKESVERSQFTNETAKQEKLDPDLNFKTKIDGLMGKGTLVAIEWAQPFFHFEDFGGFMRLRPEVLTPINGIASTDKGAFVVYKTNERGEIVMMEPPKLEKAFKKKGAGDLEPDTKKKSKAPAKGTAKADVVKGASGKGMGAMANPSAGRMGIMQGMG